MHFHKDSKNAKSIRTGDLAYIYRGWMSLLILDWWWACSYWEKCKRLLQPLFFRCSDRRGASSGTSASRSHAHGLSYAHVPVATPSRGALFLNKSCYATWRVRVLSGISEQPLGVGMTLSLGRRHAYEKDTLFQTMRLPLGESGVWGSRFPPAVKARWRRVGTTRMQASKHGSYWKCCDRKSRAACAQSFATWQQATTEIMLSISIWVSLSLRSVVHKSILAELPHCNLSYYCLLALHI